MFSYDYFLNPITLIIDPKASFIYIFGERNETEILNETLIERFIKKANHSTKGYD